MPFLIQGGIADLLVDFPALIRTNGVGHILGKKQFPTDFAGDLMEF